MENKEIRNPFISPQIQNQETSKLIKLEEEVQNYLKEAKSSVEQALDEEKKLDSLSPSKETVDCLRNCKMKWDNCLSLLHEIDEILSVIQNNPEAKAAGSIIKETEIYRDELSEIIINHRNQVELIGYLLEGKEILRDFEKIQESFKKGSRDRKNAILRLNNRIKIIQKISNCLAKQKKYSTNEKVILEAEFVLLLLTQIHAEASLINCITAISNDLSNFSKAVNRDMRERDIVELMKEDIKRLVTVMNGVDLEEVKIPANLLNEATKVYNEALTCIQFKEPVPYMMPSPSWLLPTESLPQISDKLLIHALGDAFSPKSGLESEGMLPPLQYVLSCLREFAKNEEEPLLFLKKSETLLSIAETIQREVFEVAKEQKKLSQATQNFEKILKKEFEKGNSVLIPGGWANKTSGHAMYYECERQSNGLYTFRIYNRGAGAQFIDRFSQETLRKKIPAFIELNDIQEDRIFNEKFLQSLIEMRVFAVHELSEGYSEEAEYSEWDVYKSLLQFLGGTPANVHLELEDVMGIQRGGTCSWKSLMAALRKQMSYKEYKQLKFKLKRQILLHYYEYYQADFAKDASKLNLFKKSLATFARELDDLYKEQMISETECKEMKEIFTSIQKGIESSINEQFTLLRLGTPEVPTVSIPNEMEDWVPSIKNAIPVGSSIDEAIREVTTPSLSLSETVHEWNPDPSNFKKDLEKFEKMVEESISNEQYDSAQIFIEQIIRKVPCPLSNRSGDQIFWKHLIEQEEDNPIELLEHLHHLLNQYFHASFKTTDAAVGSTMRTYTAIKFIGMHCELIQHSKEQLGLPNLPPPLSQISQLLFSSPKNREVGFLQKDPQLDEEMRIIYREIQTIGSKRGFAFNYDRSSSPRNDHPFIFYLTKDALANREPLPLEFAYIKQLIDKTDIIKEIASENKNILSMTPIEQIAYIYCHGEKHLPKAFVLWRNSYMRAHHLLHSRPSANSKVPNLAFRYSYEPPQVKIHAMFDEKTPEFQKENRYQNIQPKMKNKELEQVLDIIKTRGDLTENWSMLIDWTTRRYILPIDDIRSILRLAGTPSLQIPQTIAYFTEHMELVSDPDYQILFTILIFEKDYLMQEFQNHPEAAENLQKFLTTAYQIALDKMDVRLALFLLNTSRHLQRYLDHTRSKNPLMTKMNFLEPQKELNALLKIDGLEKEEKSLVASELLAGMVDKKTIDSDDAVQIIQSLIQLDLHPLKLELNPECEREKREALLIHNHKLKSLLDQNANLILNQVLMKVDPKAKAQEWNIEQYPIFESIDGIYTLNILTGALYTKNQTGIREMPRTILEHSDYKKLFKKTYKVSQIAINAYEFRDEYGSKFRILNKGSNQIVIQREINEKVWYQYDPSPALQNSALTLNHSSWFDCLGTGKILLLDPQGKTRYQAQYISKHKYYFIPSLSVVRLPVQNEDEELRLVNLSANQYYGEKWPYDLFERIENTEYTLLWENKDGQPSLLEFPRFGLSFAFDASDRKNPKWTCLEIPKYFISSNQFVEPLAPFQKVLVLENLDGQKKIFIPNFGPVTKKQESVFGVNLSFTFQDREKIEIFAFDLKTKPGHTKAILEPNQSEGALYLSSMMLATQEYQKARYFLDAKKIDTQRNVEQKKKLLKDLIEQRNTIQDRYASAIAIRLRAASLYHHVVSQAQHQKGSLRNAEGMNADELKLWNTVGEDFSDYIDLIHHMGNFRLSVDEEKQLFSSLIKYVPDQVNQKMVLYFEKIDPEFVFDLSIPKHAFSKANQVIQSSLTDKKKKTLISDCIQSDFANLPKSFLSSLENNWLKFRSGQPIHCFYTRPDEEMFGIFLFHLHAIKRGNKDSVREVQDILTLSQYDPNPTTQLLSAILETVMNHPEKFTIPSFPSKKNANSKAWFHWFKTIKPVFEMYLKEHPFKESEIISSTLIKGKTIRKQLPTREKVFYASHPISLTVPTEALPVKKTENLSKFPLIEREEKEEKLLGADQNLQQVLSPRKNLDRVSNKELVRLQDDCKAYVEKRAKEERKKYSTVSDQLSSYINQLHNSIAFQKEQLLAQEKEIVDQVNEKLKESHMAISTIGERFEEVSIETLIIMHAKGNLGEFIKPPHRFDEKELIRLKQKMTQHLNLAIEIQRSERELEKAEAILKLEKEIHQLQEESTKDEKTKKAITQLEGTHNDLVQELGSEASAKTHYDPQKNPECQVIEYYLNIKLRSDQVENIKKFIETGNIQPVLQMIMGSGKTEVLMPLFGLLSANGENLSILMVPDPLLETVTKKMRVKLGEAFDQKIHSLSFDRNSDSSVERLKEIKQLLLNTKNNKECLILAPETIHCLYLKFLEVWMELKKNPAHKAQFVELREILNLLGKHGSVLIDEIDQVLHCRLEVNFPVGDPISLPRNDIDLISTIYDLVLDHEEIRNLLKLDFDSLHDRPSATSFNPEFYHTVIKPKLVQLFIKQMQNNEFSNPNLKKRAVDFFIKNQDKPELIQYLVYDKTKPEELKKADEFIAQIRDRDLQNLIALAKEEFDTLLPLALGKNCDENYGLDFVGKTLLAIPFHLSKPMVGSQFANPHETANSTYQAFMEHTISEQLITDQIKTLQNQAAEALDRKKHLEDTDAYKEFMEMTGHLKNIHLMKVSSHDLHQITEQINRNHKLKKAFVRKYVLPEIKFNTRKLNSNAQNLTGVIYKVQGMSGTTYNKDTYPEKLTTFPEIATDAKTLFLLCQQPDKGIEVISSGNIEKSLDTALRNASDLAFIDTGAMLKGVDIEKMSRKLLKQAKDAGSLIKGIAFFDSQGEAVILENELADPIPLKNSRIPESERFFIYSQAYTTGANISQDRNARAIVTIGKTTLLRDLLQSVWRMRKLDQSQHVRFFIGEDDRQILNVTIGKPKEHTPTLEDLILFTALNQAKEIGMDNLLAIRQKMRFIIQKELMNILLKATPEEAETLLTEEIIDLFSPKMSIDAYELYGSLEVKKDSKEVLETDAKKTMTMMQKAVNSSKITSQTIQVEQVNQAIQKIADPSLVPEEILSKEDDNTNQRMEVQQKQETQEEATEKVKTVVTSPKPFFEGVWAPYDFDSGMQLTETIFRKDFYFQSDSYGNNTSLSKPLIEFFERDSSLIQFAKSFSTNARYLYNFSPSTPHPSNTHISKPFDHAQKPFSNLIIRQDIETKKWYIDVLDQSDAAYFRKALLKHPNPPKKEMRLCLYNTHYGIVQNNGFDPVSEKELKGDELQSLIVQTKFLNGDTDYTEQQMKLLKEWIHNQNLPLMREIFENRILKDKSDRQSRIAAMQEVWGTIEVNT